MKKILLVEDTGHLAEEIKDVLRLEGFNVVIAENGTRGIEIVADVKPDLIITDLLMAGVDGFELIARVRAMHQFARLPIIILSAKSSEADKQRGKEVGANAFVGKPCKAHELLTTINNLI